MKIGTFLLQTLKELERDTMITYKRAGLNQGLAFLVIMLGLLLFNATTAHARHVRVVTNYTTVDQIFTISTEAFFDTALITGVGPESVQVSAFTLDFSELGFQKSVLLEPINASNFRAFFNKECLTV